MLIGNYYIQRRHIPKPNVVQVHFDYQRDELPVGDFTALKATIDKRVPRHIQAFALTWARPYRVGCMSITAAFAFGFDEKYCASGCRYTWPDPYFNSSTAKPYDDLHIRPTMSIAAIDFDHAQALIERGIRADRTEPRGTAYLLSTDDALRNTRAAEYAPASPFARPESRSRSFTTAASKIAATCCFISSERAPSPCSKRIGFSRALSPTI